MRKSPKGIPVKCAAMIARPTTQPSMTLFGIRNNSNPVAAITAPIQS